MSSEADEDDSKVKNIKNILRYNFLTLKDMIETNPDEVNRYTNIIINNFVQLILRKPIQSDSSSVSMERLILNRIANHKEEIFESLFNNHDTSELEYWRYALRNTLGLNSNKNYLEYLHKKLIYLNREKVLRAFYNEFTPDSIINKLLSEFNQYKKLLDSCGKILSKNKDIEEHFSYNEMKLI